MAEQCKTTGFIVVHRRDPKMFLGPCYRYAGNSDPDKGRNPQDWTVPQPVAHVFATHDDASKAIQRGAQMTQDWIVQPVTIEFLVS